MNATADTIPIGYKRTEAGVIPRDWNSVSLENVTRAIGDGIHATPVYSETGSYYFINGNNIRDGRVQLFEDTKRVESSEFRKHGKTLDGRTVLLSINGTIGNVALYGGERVVLGKSAAYLSCSSSTDHKFVFYALQTRRVAKQFDDGLTGTTIKNLGLSTIRDTQIPLPPTMAEQEAIAEALGDADALIESLDGLVAKKRHLKQAAMQQLLTGKTRLPGFEGEWEVKSLGDIAETDPENLSSDTTPDYTFKYISLEDVDRGVLRGYSEQQFRTAPSRARRKVRRNDVLASTVRPNLLSHLWFDSEDDDWICSTGFCVIRCGDGVASAGYIFQHLFGDFISRQINALLTGSNYPAINSGDVRSLEVPVPSFEEQKAIAEVLSDMDTEIEALEAKLAKARQIKQGMMQELLTGSVRLVKPKQGARLC